MLNVGVADRAADLVDSLVEMLADPLADPFQSEWVSVPSLGFRSWLRFELSQRLGQSTGADGSADPTTSDRALGGDGVAANIEMPFPGSLRWRILRAYSAGQGRLGTSDPWEVDRLVWTVLEVMSDPETHIDDRLRRAKLPAGVTLASRAGPIADLFDRYGVHRPQMVNAWAGGHDVDADGHALPDDRRWQPRLYRAVRDRLLVDHDVSPPAERLVAALEQIRNGDLDLSAPLSPTEPGLPPRLAVVGQSILTAELGPVLAAVAEHAEVCVMLLSPSARRSVELARHVVGSTVTASGPSSWASRRNEHPETSESANHPLLQGWGRRPLESALLLGAGGVVPNIIGPASSTPVKQGRDTLLGRIQSDIRTGTTPTDRPPTPIDSSLQIHAAPGRTRQVEVLRDVVLGLLRDDPSLGEDQIAVLCPQLEEFAPVITAVLGPPARRGDQPDGGVPALRYTLIDRDARSFNPVLAAMQTVLDVMPGRFDTSSVRDLMHSPAVRNRFALTDDDLALFSEWTEDAEVRWGLDGAQRQPWGIDGAHRANSWATAVDQIMVGVALGDPLRRTSAPGATATPVDEAEAHSAAHALAVGGIVPAEIAEGAIASAGRIAAAIRSLAAVHALLIEDRGPSRGPGADSVYRPVSRWRDLLTQAADHLLAPDRFEDWQRAALDDALANLVAASADSEGEPSSTELTFGDVKRLLAPALEGQRARADLGFGSMVIARPALLAGVPFRVVCILGLDDDAIPAGQAGGDDLLAALSYVGDRDPRSEARAEILAGLLAAQDHLVITCSSRDVRTNAEVPHAVGLDELIDLITATTAHPTDADDLVCSHPRQAFDPTNFVPSATSGEPFGFDPTARDGAEALVRRLTSKPRPTGANLLLTSPLPEPTDHSKVIDLGDLKGFYDHPVRHFFRRRFQLRLPRVVEPGDDQLPTSLNRLKASGIGTDLLEVGMALGDPDQVLIDPDDPYGDLPEEVRVLLDYHRATGVLPPPSVANTDLAAMSDEVAEILTLASAYDALRSADQSHDVEVTLADGTTIRGRVNRCSDGPRPGPVRLMYNRFKPKYLVSAAIDLLVLTASRPEVEWRGVLITRGDSKKPPQTWGRAVVGGTADERRRSALDALAILVSQYRDGACYPLPLFDATSYALIHGAGPRTSARSAARAKWGDHGKDRYSWSREAQDDYHLLAFGPLEFDDLETIELGGHTLSGEADRLWGTLDGALVELDAELDTQLDDDVLATADTTSSKGERS